MKKQVTSNVPTLSRDQMNEWKDANERLHLLFCCTLIVFPLDDFPFWVLLPALGVATAVASEEEELTDDADTNSRPMTPIAGQQSLQRYYHHHPESN